MQCVLLDVRQNVIDPSGRLVLVGPQIGVTRPGESPAAGGQPFRSAFVVQTPQGKLLQVVLALHHPCRLAGRLNGWQQQRDQDADDRDHDQKLDQRKTTPGSLMR